METEKQSPRGGVRAWCRAYLYEDPAVVRAAAPNTAYRVFFGMALLLMLMGVLQAGSLSNVIDGYRIMLTHPVTLDFDTIKWSGYGAAFLNAGIMQLLVLAVYRLTKTDLQGTQIAAMMMATGFAFYGKNPVNVWFPVIGVFINARIHKQRLSDASALAWFSTSLSPVFNVVAFGTPALTPASPVAIILGAVLAVTAGMLVGMFANFLPRLHKGRVLYNAGFAAGLAGMVINGLLSAFALGHEKYPYTPENYVTGDNLRISLLLGILFAYFIIAGILMRGGPRYRKMLWYRCFGGNFIKEFGFSTSLVNMGVIGLLGVLYVDMTGTGQLGGPIIACILTAVGFAAAGVTIREYLPTIAGVFAAAFLSGGMGSAIGGGDFFVGAMAKVGSRPMLLAAIFSCGLAPIAGVFGALSGFFVGALHSLIVPLTGSLHGWMSLYNNGFSMGLIVVFFLPMYKTLKRVSKRERETHIGPED